MEVTRKNVVFKFTDEDILAIKRTKDIIDIMTDSMDYERDKIKLNDIDYRTNDIIDGSYRFLYNFAAQLSESRTIEVTE